MAPKHTPATRAAGHTAFSALPPPNTSIRYAGRNTAIGAQMRPTPELSTARGSPVTPASVTIGVAIAPKATGAVLAIRHSAAA